MGLPSRPLRCGSGDARNHSRSRQVTGDTSKITVSNECDDEDDVRGLLAAEAGDMLVNRRRQSTGVAGNGNSGKTDNVVQYHFVAARPLIVADLAQIDSKPGCFTIVLVRNCSTKSTYYIYMRGTNSYPPTVLVPVLKEVLYCAEWPDESKPA